MGDFEVNRSALENVLSHFLPRSELLRERTDFSQEFTWINNINTATILNATSGKYEPNWTQINVRRAYSLMCAAPVGWVLVLSELPGRVAVQLGANEGNYHFLSPGESIKVVGREKLHATWLPLIIGSNGGVEAMSYSGGSDAPKPTLSDKYVVLGNTNISLPTHHIKPQFLGFAPDDDDQYIYIKQDGTIKGVSIYHENGSGATSGYIRSTHSLDKDVPYYTTNMLSDKIKIELEHWEELRVSWHFASDDIDPIKIIVWPR